MPMPALAPSRHRSPMEMPAVPPPDRVPMIEAPPPMSEPSPTTTPWLIRPSTLEVPSVPALKLTKPPATTTAPGRSARRAEGPRVEVDEAGVHPHGAGREVRAEPHPGRVGDADPVGQHVVGEPREAVEPQHVEAGERQDRQRPPRVRGHPP